MAKSKFTFKQLKIGYAVVVKGKELGTILPTKEATGRHAFYLGCDSSKSPRTYRGKVKAAEAIQSMHTLIEKHKKKKKATLEQLIVSAWDERPRASEQW